MPRGDGTGPMGMGPMTGRGAGYCAGYPVPGAMNPMGGRWGGGGGRGGGWGRGFGRGLGLGFRGGRGWGGAWGGVPYAAPWGAAPYAGAYPAPYAAPWGAAPTAAQEVEALRGHAESLEEALAGIRKRIEEFETEKKKEK